MADEKELQEKMLIYRTLESRLDALTKQVDLISSKIVEVVSTISSIEDLEKNQENILFRLGSETYTHGKVTDKNKLLVEIGAGIVLEKSIEESKQTLNKRREEMENALREIQTNISKISNAMNKLTPEINELIQKSQMQPAAG